MYRSLIAVFLQWKHFHRLLCSHLMWLLSPFYHTEWCDSTTTSQQWGPSEGGWASSGSWGQPRPTEQSEDRMAQCIECMQIWVKGGVACILWKPESIFTTVYLTNTCAHLYISVMCKCSDNARPQLKITAVSTILILCSDWALPVYIALSIKLWFMYCFYLHVFESTIACYETGVEDIVSTTVVSNLQITAA